MLYDVVIAGGGPSGLSAALQLGRARRRVLVCDAGVPRNVRAKAIQGFVTRDGTPPAEFRRIGREQLQPYETVTVQDVRMVAVRGEKGAFDVELASGSVQARRVILCTGMIDDVPALPGFRELWGHSVFQCPYCHGWEVRDQAFGYLAMSPGMIDFAMLLLGWTPDVMVFTDARFEVPGELRERLATAQVRLEERRIRRLVPKGDHLDGVELEDGTWVPRAVLFAHPPQRQTELVQTLGVDLDEQGYVRVTPEMETSRPGVFAAGDLATMRHGAILAAAAGTLAASTLNHHLTVELALRRELR